MIRIRPTKGRRPTARSRCVRIILSAFLAAIVNLPVALNAGDDEIVMAVGFLHPMRSSRHRF